MKKQLRSLSIILLIMVFTLSCNEREDPGPLQEYTKQYPVLDFDRLEMGSAFNIKVEEANTFNVTIKGDRRNIDDLDVFKSGSTLMIKYKNNANRKHQTYVMVTLPKLKSVNFSGASVSVIKGFESNEVLDLYLSGASIAQLDAGYKEINLVLSGASNLVMHGLGDQMNAEISGASVLNAFDFPVRETSINISGSSQAKVTASDALHVTASGASSVFYRGNPSIDTTVGGDSKVEKE